MAKTDARAAGYMELTGAKKDAVCQIVDVRGGVSQQRGCCNLFEPENGDVMQFRCGTCEYVLSKEKALRNKYGS